VITPAPATQPTDDKPKAKKKTKKDLPAGRQETPADDKAGGSDEVKPEDIPF
jgi:hypothetical protein